MSRRKTSLSPETNIALSLKQVIFALAAVLVAGSGWAYLVMGQQSTSKDVGDIKAQQAVIASTTAGIVKDQDEKRAMLAKEFIASQEKIAAKIGDLTTLVAVQQNQQKTTDEKLSKVLDQIGTFLEHKR
jgi:ribosomal protein L30E